MLIFTVMIQKVKLQELLQQSVFNKAGTMSGIKIKQLPNTLKLAIIHYTPSCATDKLSERIYWIISNIDRYPKYCLHPNCNNPITNFRNGEYIGKFCSHSCNSSYKLLINGNPFSGELGIKRRQHGMMSKYGVDHNMKIQSTLNKRQQTYLANYGVTHPLKNKQISNNIRHKHEQAGRWTPKSLMDSFRLYSTMVKHFTNLQDISNLPNFNKRGHSQLPDSYHLDHKFSVQAGFLNNIPPYIIGNIVNLEFIPHSINSSKREKCSISMDELFILFESHNLSISPNKCF